MSNDDCDDPKLEAQWFAEQRDKVRQYLEDEGVQHRGIASRPEWFLAPYVSIWTVESMKKPDAIGWWVISGGLPKDYLSGQEATDARTALAAFADRWREVSSDMIRGEEHPIVKIGRSDDRRELGELLGSRAEIIERGARDDEMW